MSSHILYSQSDYSQEPAGAGRFERERELLDSQSPPRNAILDKVYEEVDIGLHEYLSKNIFQEVYLKMRNTWC